jgi:hypothetical protein
MLATEAFKIKLVVITSVINLKFLKEQILIEEKNELNFEPV